ncbi:MAG: alcohol dehydrogenase catalytic domain-containing protein [Calditrichaeota bacterium]|nr:alcohol dehydrogenase catalytic domain-containing protein [Calditrichota bacterium]MCB9366727.1 alcohol dehydrogenase catalytic domain-containing protein [Calditrichota bacterium]
MQAIQKSNIEPGLTYLDKAPSPEITTPHDVIVKVKAAGICGTDVHIYAAKPSLMSRMGSRLPLTIGHEFCGEIVELSSGVEGLEIGQFVSAEMHWTCGQCHNCRTGNGNWCISHTVGGIDEPGAFADYVKLPASSIVPLPPDLPVEVAAYLDAIGNSVYTVRSADVVGKDVAVLGAGPLGILAVSLCRLMGAKKIYVTDVSDYVLRVAKDEGADEVFNVSDEKQHVEFLKMATSDPAKGGLDVVFEMSGAPSAYADAFKALSMGGEFVLLGLPSGEIPVSFSSDVVLKGITIKSIFGRRIFNTWTDMLALLQGEFLKSAKRIVTHHFALADFDRGFQTKLAGEGLKVVLYPGGLPKAS